MRNAVSHRSRRRGFALVLCLILTMLVGLALLGTVRHSMTVANAALDGERRLQERYGTLSCQRTGLLIAPAVLAERIAGSTDRLPSVVASTRLGEMDVQLILSDEQGKANPNLWRQQQDPQTVDARLRELMLHSRVAARLHLNVSDRETSARSFADVLPSGEASAFIELSVPHQPTHGAVTLWSDGKINVRSATDRTLRVGLADAMDALKLDRFIAARRQFPGSGLSDWIAACDLTDAERTSCQARLVERSRAYSVWINTRVGKRDRTRFVAMLKRPSDDSVFTLFEW